MKYFVRHSQSTAHLICGPCVAKQPRCKIRDMAGDLLNHELPHLAAPDGLRSVKLTQERLVSLNLSAPAWSLVDILSSPLLQDINQSTSTCISEGEGQTCEPTLDSTHYKLQHLLAVAKTFYSKEHTPIPISLILTRPPRGSSYIW